MDFSDEVLERSQINYMFTRNLIDPMLDRYWDGSCQTDPISAGCKFFFTRYDELLNKVNLQNLYGTCYPTPVSLLTGSIKSGFGAFRDKNSEFFNMNRKCQYYEGIEQYFHNDDSVTAFRSKTSNFAACNQTIFASYDRNLAGSMIEYSRIIA